MGVLLCCTVGARAPLLVGIGALHVVGSGGANSHLDWAGSRCQVAAAYGHNSAIVPMLTEYSLRPEAMQHGIGTIHMYVARN